MLQFQYDIETLFHKNQLFPRIKAEFEGYPIFEDAFKEAQIEPEFGYALLVQMVLHKRASLPTLVGILKKHHDDDCQATADALLRACHSNLVDWHPIAKQFIIRFEISPDVQAELDRYQYPMPLVVEPKEVTDNRDTGYYTSKGSIILKDNHHDDDVCLDHINRMNRIKLRINMDVALTVKNRWRGLDKQAEDEDRQEFLKRKKQFEKFDRTAYDVMDHLGLSNEGEFWLTHKYDKRGRTYCQGYHVNYQGAPWNKAVIEFANGETIE